MIIVMKPGAEPEHIRHVQELIHEAGLKEHILNNGGGRTLIAAIGDDLCVPLGALQSAPMVEKVMPIRAPYKMASREVHPEQTLIEIGPNRFPIGGTKVGIIAGPCAVEHRDQILRAAEAAQQAGAIGLRGGAYKPRTSPYSFQGLQEQGLDLLAEAREKTGLAIVTEVMSAESLPKVAAVADVLQIGTRNMYNYPLLEALGEYSKPVLLKRGFCATINEWLLAAEYVINAGNPDIMMCERGIRTFEDYCRNTLPLAVVPELRERTHLPIVVDPSHGTGKASLVPAMCRAAVAAGADALLLEMHPDPEHALSDGSQSLTPSHLEELLPTLRTVARAVGRDL
jgi:3-deoxy-7-phosphoheptulonate synthase